MDQPTEFKDSKLKDNNLWQAGAAVADSLSQFEGAMDKLVGRMELTGDQLQRVMEIKERAENVLNQVIGFSQRAVGDVKKNPKAYIALAAVVGLFIMSRSGRLTKNNVIG